MKSDPILWAMLIPWEPGTTGISYERVSGTLGMIAGHMLDDEIPEMLAKLSPEDRLKFDEQMDALNAFHRTDH